MLLHCFCLFFTLLISPIASESYKSYQCLKRKGCTFVQNISSFEEAEFRNFVVQNGSYYSSTFDKQRSLSQVQIFDDPVPRFLDGKWIRGNTLCRSKVWIGMKVLQANSIILGTKKLWWIFPIKQKFDITAAFLDNPKCSIT